MSDGLITGGVSVALALVATATIAAALSKNADTSKVISAGTGGLATDILAAVSPITGQTPQIQSQIFG